MKAATRGSTAHDRGRRGNGEGSIYQRASDGLWLAVITVGYTEAGKPKRKSYSGRTRPEVAEKLKVALRDQQLGTLPTAPDRQVIGEYLEYWLENAARRTVRARTHESYETIVRLYIAPEWRKAGKDTRGLGKLRLAKLAGQDVEAWLNRLLARGLSARTVEYALTVLRRALGHAVKLGLIQRNVALLVDPPRVVQKEMRALTPQEARSFLDAVRGDPLEALYTVAVALGLRRGEALALRWQDVDMERGTLAVNGSLQRFGGKLQISETKTPRSRRTITMPTVVRDAFRAHRVRQLEQRMAARKWQETGLVFTTSTGTAVEPRNVVRAFKAALQRAGLPDIRFHDLRHTAASLLLAQGVHPRVIMETLGHSQFGTTMNLYSHVTAELQRDAADRMDALLGTS
jgi:integrase